MNTLIPARLAALRQAMQTYQVTACFIPSSDPHLSEYQPEHWKARHWFSGFDGSAATLIVTLDWAGLWTDSRYFEQAEKQLENTGVTLMRQNTAGVLNPLPWLAEHLGACDTLAVAADVISNAQLRRMQQLLAPSTAGITTAIDVPQAAWPERPTLPTAAIFEQPLEYAITPRTAKLAQVRTAMQSLGASHHLVSTLDDIAWITNLRGADISYNPVFLAHLLIDASHATLFVDATRIPPDLQQALADDGISQAPYDQAADTLAALPSSARLLYSPAQTVAATTAALPASISCIEARNPSTAMKALKTDAAIEQVRATMRQDGAALVIGFHQIETAVLAGEPITELDVTSILYKARADRPGFISESFNTIAGFKANAALPHYAATPDSHSPLSADGLLLVDSGGQYLGGTTDITRVWAFGSTSEEQRRDFTQVLKGMINLSRARFPKGTSGPQIDALARAPLWAAGCDFGHGTGHGVGYFLNVHEGPQSIRPPRDSEPKIALEVGMITSIEPGIYKPGRHGIRHENLACVRSSGHTEFGEFLEFETLTLCPFDSRALELTLLSVEEIDWLNHYHQHVEEALAPLLDDAADRQWLHERCQPLA